MNLNPCIATLLAAVIWCNHSSAADDALFARRPFPNGEPVSAFNVKFDALFGPAGTPPGGGNVGAEALGLVNVEESRTATRIRGWIVPEVTGRYRFGVAGDDEVDFRLGAGPELAAFSSVARVIRWTAPEDFSVFACQTSGLYDLVAGQRYAFELRHVQFDGAGHFSLRWALDGQPLQVIPASVIQPWSASQTDQNNNGLPDSWEEQTGLGSVGGPESAAWHADPDGDGVENGEEWRIGGHPMVADASERPGTAFAEKWSGIPGPYIVDLKRSGFDSIVPSQKMLLKALEFSGEPGSDFGTRIRARIIPAVSGEYTFWLSGDDSAELWLGSMNGQAPLQRIAQVAGPTGFRQWDANPMQKSAPLTLTAGEPVFLEVLHKQKDGDNHLSVGWKLPGTNTIEVISGTVLLPSAPRAGDANGNGIADEWEAGFVSEGNSLAPFEDPDRDGADNRAEFLRQTGPLTAQLPEAGALLCERWTESPGNYLSSLTSLSRFPSEPSESFWLAYLDYRNDDPDYGCRLRGWLTVPASADYAFDVSGDNAVQLWLGTDDAKFSKKLVAEVGGWSARRTAGERSSQSTGNIHLEGGQRYYIEILHKQGSRAGHLSVRIRIPGFGWCLVPSEWLSPWQRTATDSDDDDLPDLWERSHGMSTDNAAGSHGGWGDPDGDGLNNFAEYQLGTDPMQADAAGTRGLVFWEAWQGVYGDSISHLLNSPTFPTAPSVRAWRTSLTGPAGFDDQYGSRMRTQLEPRKSGKHTFWLTGDNHTRLYLSSDDSKFHKRLIAEVADYSQPDEWTKRPAQRSAGIVLQAGHRYFLEVLHKEKWGEDHAAVSWQEPDGEEFAPIPGSCLIAVSRDPQDADDDDLPDEWETAQGLSTAAGGMHGASGDVDGDGLTNAEEFLLGTSASSPDSDGDGLSDGDEVNGLHSNPLVADAGVLKVAGTTLGGMWQEASTGWFSPAADVAMLGVRRGQITWQFTAQEAGCKILRVYVRLTGGPAEGTEAESLLTLDGRPLANRSLRTTPQSGRTTILLTTPWLTEGAHSLKAEFLLGHASAFLQVDKVEVLKPEGPSTVQAGVPDWLMAHLSASNPAPEPQLSSMVSPVCLEGSARLPAWGTVTSSATEGTQAVDSGLLEHWYANAPLDESGQDTLLTIKRENGLLTHTVTGKWQPFNVRSFTTYSIRKGDALRLTSHSGPVPEGSPVTISITGPLEQELSFSDDHPAVFRFSEPGNYTLRTGQEGAPEAAVCELKVLAADFGPELLMYSGQGGRWECPGVPHDVVVEADERLELREDIPPPETGRILHLFAYGLGERRLLARLSDTGPILASGLVKLSKFQTAQQGGHELISTLPDGTQLLRTTLVASALPAGGSIVIRIIVGGVSFADGSIVRILTAADFDANGIAKVDFLKAPGVNSATCHRITILDSAGRIVAEF